MILIRRCLTLFILSAVLSGYGQAPNPSALFDAIDKGQLSKLQALDRRGADVFTRDGLGRSLLHEATLRGNAPIVRYLISRGLDVDARTMLGETPLHYAAGSGDDRLIQILLGAGASPRAYTKKCFSPADFAAGFGSEQSWKTLKAALQKQPLPLDGTRAECANKLAVSGRSTTRLMFFKRSFTIESGDDYPYAVASASYLQSHPEIGRNLMVELIDLVDHPTASGHGDTAGAAKDARLAAITTLKTLATTKRQKEEVTKSMLELVERGSCSVYQATACVEAQCDRIGPEGLFNLAKSLIDGKARNIRGNDEAVCYDCKHCPGSHIEQGHEAALEWFRTTSQSPKAKAALQRQLKEGVLPQAEFDALTKLLQNRDRPVVESRR